VGKISHFLALSVNISKTVGDTAKVTISDLEQSANGFEGPVADSWTILQPAKDRNVHSQLLYTLAQPS